MSSASHSDLDDRPLSPTTEQNRRQNGSWGVSLSGLFSRLADAAEASENRLERWSRSRDASTTGRDLPSETPTELVRAESSPISGRSLGGLLRQLSGRQEVAEPRQEPAESTAAAAERHRLSGASSSIDLQALMQWIEKNAPFMCILFLVFVVNHIGGIAVFAFISAIIATCNDFIRKQIAMKDGRRVFRLALMMVLASTVLPLPLLIPHSCLSWRTMILLLPPRVDTVWDCLYCVTIADGAIRIASLVVKMGMLIWCKASPDENFRRRSQLLTLVEHFSLLYRALVPTPLWFVYLYKSRGVLSSIFTGAFLATKCQFVYDRVNNVISSIKAVGKRESQYGKFLTQEEVMEAGNTCPICQESMTRPFQLARCRHIFCEACLTEWLERQCTCPMCRAVVRQPGMQAFGNGAVSLLPQLF